MALHLTELLTTGPLATSPKGQSHFRDQTFTFFSLFLLFFTLILFCSLFFFCFLLILPCMYVRTLNQMSDVGALVFCCWSVLRRWWEGRGEGEGADPVVYILTGKVSSNETVHCRGVWTFLFDATRLTASCVKGNHTWIIYLIIPW